MSSAFKPLTLDLIDEGRFRSDLEDEVATGMRRLLEFKKKYGVSASRKAKATITAKITIVFEGRDENDFSIKAQAAHSVPTKPASLSVAMGAKDDAQNEVLFVRASGSSEIPPEQAILCTKDGRVVEPAGDTVQEPKL